MPRLEGLGMFHAGDLATTYGLGANGMAQPDIQIPAHVDLTHAPDTEVELGSCADTTVETCSEPAFSIEIAVAAPPEFSVEVLDAPDTEIEVNHEVATTIELVDAPDTEIELGDD